MQLKRKEAAAMSKTSLKALKKKFSEASDSEMEKIRSMPKKLPASKKIKGTQDME